MRRGCLGTAYKASPAAVAAASKENKSRPRTVRASKIRGIIRCALSSLASRSTQLACVQKFDYTLREIAVNGEANVIARSGARVSWHLIRRFSWHTLPVLIHPKSSSKSIDGRLASTQTAPRCRLACRGPCTQPSDCPAWPKELRFIESGW